MATTARYGSWKSPISTRALTSGEIGLSESRIDGDDIYWLEARPQEQGRQVVVKFRQGHEPEDVIPEGFNARTKVHEYGGGAYLASNGVVFFSNFADQRLYRQDAPGGTPTPITPEPEEKAGVRFADGARLSENELVYVRETHAGGEVTNDIAVVSVDGSVEPRTLIAGNDFYSSPRPSPDGRQLAWLTWNNPNMPWDGTELWLADIGDGKLSNEHLIAGGVDESVLEPRWSPDGVLHFVGERTGWWNLYRFSDGSVEALCPAEEEFSATHWQFGLSCYGFLADGRIVCMHGVGGEDKLSTLEGGALEDVELERTGFDPRSLTTSADKVVFIAASPTLRPALISLDPSTGTATELALASSNIVDPGYISVPDSIVFETDGGLEAHAFFYPPRNADFVGPDDEHPPLIVFSHGGPTGFSGSELSLIVQYFTSRGVAIVDVNYGGSTGYGKEYRERLKGQWGVVDVADCVNAARYLVKEGLVDGNKLAIRGGSAGGYTTFCGLVFYDDFNAGVSLFGVADLETFVRITHKFEARYLDSLVGPYPESKDLYQQRSPVNFIDRITCPMLLLQGLEDEVVPPSQADQMVEAFEQRGIPYAYIPFEGEQHGFRRAASIERATESEFGFYARVFGFEPADELPPLDIKNL
ncbi:MAG: prolyl oligopeptidase family serine peptidase [Actinomycetota bacterium]|nr:S9 family peptidase [Actinomycetota bacterium]